MKTKEKTVLQLLEGKKYPEIREMIRREIRKAVTDHICEPGSHHTVEVDDDLISGVYRGIYASARSHTPGSTAILSLSESKEYDDMNLVYWRDSSNEACVIYNASEEIGRAATKEELAKFRESYDFGYDESYLRVCSLREAAEDYASLHDFDAEVDDAFAVLKAEYDSMKKNTAEEEA